MRGLTALACGCVLVAALTSGAVATPPQPGTTASGLTESEEATLWSNVPAEQWDSDATADTAMQDLARRTDLSFSEPPDTAKRWNRYAHGEFQPGGRDASVHPESAILQSGTYIKDAHATIFAATPSTRVHVDSGDTRRYVDPEGTLRGVIDYRIERPEATSDSNGDTRSYRVIDDEIETVRLEVDGEHVASQQSPRPEFAYEFAGGTRTLQLEARIGVTIEETIRPPPGSNRSTRTQTHETSMAVRDSIDVEVYDIDAVVRHARYPDGSDSVVISQAAPWQGYTLSATADASHSREIRGVWRFFTARPPRWQRLVTSSEAGTSARDSHAIPVSVHAYPSTLSPRALPTHGGPLIQRTWGDRHDSPKSSLPEHVTVEVVDRPYTETQGMAVRDESLDPSSITVQGIVHGVTASARPLLGASTQIRETTLSATVVDSITENATVLVEIEDAATGEPIELRGTDTGTKDDPGGGAGHIEIGDQRVRTNASGEATVQLTESGSYTVEYVPVPWFDTPSNRAGAETTVRWQPHATLDGVLSVGIQIGLLVAPVAIAWYAGRRLAAMIGFTRGGRR
jgi:hypothetical protein